MQDVVGYVISRSTPRKVNFVIKRGERVELGQFYAVEHPFWGKGGPIVLLRVYDISSMNEEMDLGRTGVIASSAGLVPVFQGELEYLVAYAEVLGYRDPIDGRIKGLEIPPSTGDPVFKPSKEDLREFFSSTESSYRVPIGKLSDSDIDFYLDLDSLARGHAFVAGMTRSGKSVSGDSITVIYDVKERKVIVEPIGEFVDRILGKGVESGTKELGRRYYALCLERKDFRPTWSRITAVHKHLPSKCMYEIRTDKGRRLLVTGDHSLLVFDGLKLREAKPRSLVKKGPFWLVSPVETPPPMKRKDGVSPELVAAVVADGSVVGKEVVIHAPDKKLLKIVQGQGIKAKLFRDYLLLRDQQLREIAEQGLAFLMTLPVDEERRAVKEFLKRTSYQSYDGSRVMFSHPLQTTKVACSLSLLGLEPEIVGPSWILFDEKRVQQALRKTASDGGPVFHHLPELGEVVKRERIKRGMWRHDFAVRVGISADTLKKIEDGEFVGVKEMTKVLEFLGGHQALRLLTKPFLSLERIVEVRKLGPWEEPVYDLSVEKWENFVANGFFVHNSTFVLNLIENSQRIKPRPRFLVLDKRGEYSILAKKGAAIFDYRTFLPKQGALTPKDISRRLGIDRGSLRSLVELAAEEVLGEGEISPEALLKKAKELAIAMDVRERKKLISQLQIKLKRSGRFLRPRGMGQDIIEAVKKFPIVVLDFSIDADYEDQFLAVRDMIRKILRYAISRREKGDFALIVVLEEAQYLIPERNAPLVGNPFDSGVYSTLIEAISQSGGYNVGFVVVTQRPAYVSKAVISQCNTVACFRLKNLNDQEAIAAYTEGGGEIKNYLSSLGNHEAMIWGMASEIPFPVTVRMKPKIFPAKASAPPSVAWKKMAES